MLIIYLAHAQPQKFGLIAFVSVFRFQRHVYRLFSHVQFCRNKGLPLIVVVRLLSFSSYSFGAVQWYLSQRYLLAVVQPYVIWSILETCENLARSYTNERIENLFIFNAPRTAIRSIDNLLSMCGKPSTIPFEWLNGSYEKYPVIHISQSYSSIDMMMFTHKECLAWEQFSVKHKLCNRSAVQMFTD